MCGKISEFRNGRLCMVVSAMSHSLLGFQFQASVRLAGNFGSYSYLLSCRGVDIFLDFDKLEWW